MILIFENKSFTFLNQTLWFVRFLYFAAKQSFSNSARWFSKQEFLKSYCINSNRIRIRWNYCDTRGQASHGLLPTINLQKTHADLKLYHVTFDANRRWCKLRAIAHAPRSNPSDALTLTSQQNMPDQLCSMPLLLHVKVEREMGNRFGPGVSVLLLPNPGEKLFPPPTPHHPPPLSGGKESIILSCWWYGSDINGSKIHLLASLSTTATGPSSADHCG